MKKMRKAISLIVALCFLLSIAAPAMAADASDVEKAGNRLLALGIIEGYTDGTLGLDKQITRAEIAVVLAKASGMASAAEMLKNTPSKFTDVKTGEWYTGWINLAASQGWVKGDPQGTFRPNDPISYREIVTVLMKILGYNDNLPGEWPANYLAKAASLGITKGISFDAKAPAVRGDVFLMTSRVLDKEVVVWDSDKNEFVYKNGKTLLEDKLEFATVEGVVTDIPRIGLDEDEIEIDGKVYDVVGDIDYNVAFGAEVTAWLNDDEEVVYIDIESDILYDAIEFNKADKEVKLVEADKKYDLADNVKIYVNAKNVSLKDINDGAEYDYAKLVLNDKGDVAFIEAYNWDGFLVVESVGDEIIYGYDDDELNAKDFTIVKNGRTITLDELEEGDILYYNNAKNVKFAEVYNASYVGKIERVYEDAIKIDGTELDIIDGYSVYLDGKDLKDFNDEVADDMRKEGGDVTVYVNRYGEIAFVIGDTGKAETSKFYAFVLENGKFFSNRGEEMWTLDVLSASGSKLSYDLDEDVDGNWKGTIEFDNKLTQLGVDGDSNPIYEAPDYSAGDVVEIEVDADGSIESVNKLTRVVTISGANNNKFETDDKYAAGKKLQASAVIFDIADTLTPPHDADDILVTTLGEYKASEISGGKLYYNSSDRVVVIVVTNSDREGDEDYDAVLVAAPRKVSGEKVYRLDLNINGQEDTYYTVKKIADEVYDSVNEEYKIGKGDFLKVTVDKENKEITDLVPITADTRVKTDLEISSISVTNSRIVANGTTYRLSDATLLDKDYDPISIRDLAVGDKVKVLLVDDNSSYVAYLVVTAEADDEDDDDLDENAITATYADTTLTISVNTDEIEDAYAVRVYDVDSNDAIGGFSVLNEGVATITGVEQNPVFVIVKVYDNAGKLLAQAQVTVAAE